MFSLNRGDVVLPVAVSAVTNAADVLVHGAVGLGSWNTSVQYTNIVVTSNGVVLYQSDFVNQGTNGWRVYNGAWSTNAGIYQQTLITTDCRSTTGNTNWANYTLTLRARKVSGSEGFLILFNWLDDNNWTWWNIGGWGNTLDGIEQMTGGAKSLVGSQISETIATNVWYDLRIVLTGPRIQCYLNNQLIQDVTYATYGLFASSSYDKAGGQIIVKAVNAYNQPITTTFNLAGVNSISPTGTVIQLTSANATDENSLAAPANVFPVTNAISAAGTNFTLTLPASSFSILRLQAGGINACTNLSLQVPTPITNGVSVASTVWGRQSGNWINLTANSNHAILYASADTNIAAVDVNGMVTGVGVGGTSIIASYPALGLSATQTVQVVYVPAPPVTLVHRYSSSEIVWTTVPDSVGGPAWNGTLPRGGTLNGGQLVLSSNLQQYVQLPAGILSNYTAVTIETWVTFPDQLPVNCFFFGFGNTNGNVGVNYIFCAPRAGRAAISSGSNPSEQNAYTGIDFSYHTNFHLAFVFNPPAGNLAIYMNGTLAAVNNSVTIGFNSVSNLYSWIGRSLYSGDPYPDFTLDEFRIYNGALSASDVAATQALGPDQVLTTNSPVLGAFMTSAGSLTLSWPVASSGYTVLAATNLETGNWTTVFPAPQIVGGQWQVTVSPSDSASFYRLQK